MSTSLPATTTAPKRPDSFIPLQANASRLSHAIRPYEVVVYSTNNVIVDAAEHAVESIFRSASARNEFSDPRVVPALQTANTILIHGCNDKRVMGAGIAAAIKHQFPDAVAPYFDTATDLRVGTWTVGQAGNAPGLLICNLITQTLGDPPHNSPDFVGQAESTPFSYIGFRRGIRSLFDAWSEHRGITFFMPAIGSGLGGANFATVLSILAEEHLQHLDNVLGDPANNTAELAQTFPIRVYVGLQPHPHR